MKNFPFEKDGETYWYARSLACAVLAYTEKDGKYYVLACKRGQGCEFNQGLWNVPGGFIDFNENAEQCAKREFFEETGIALDHDPIFKELHTKPDGRRQTMVARFVTYIDYDNIEEANTDHCEPGEVEEIKWIPVNELCQYKWTRGQVRAILFHMGAGLSCPRY